MYAGSRREGDRGVVVVLEERVKVIILIQEEGCDERVTGYNCQGGMSTPCHTSRMGCLPWSVFNKNTISITTKGRGEEE